MAVIYWVVWILLLGFGVTLAWIARWLHLRWWPSLLLRMVLLGLVGWAVFAVLESEKPSEYQPEVLILDLSDSIQDESKFQSQVFATAWQKLKPKRQVIVFGSSSDYLFSENWPEIDGEASDLNQALAEAELMLDGQSGRVILATDGSPDEPAMFEAWIEKIKASGVEVDYILLDGVQYANDASLGKIKGITNVWSGMPFPVFVPVHSDKSQQAILRVFVNGGLYDEGNVQLAKGETILPVMLQAGTPGVMSIEIHLIIDGDAFMRNNISFASVQVFPQPKVLIITKNEGVVANLANGLNNQGSDVKVISPQQFPTRLEELKTFEVIMIHDLLAQDLNYDQMQALKLHVLELGKGLIFLGGRNSFTLGGYQNTLLEPLMPIVLTPPDRVQRVPITFLLVLDRSGSMAGDRDTEIAPIDLTREAAMRAIETLRSDDYLGVLSFSGSTSWDVDLRNVGEGLDLRIAQDKVSQIVAVGGTFMYQALEEAVNQLVVTETTDYPHILLMSDGVSGDGSSDEFNRLVDFAASNGITISTIALGNESDPETLARIAEVGGGRFYQVLNPQDLPQVMISESRAVQAENVQEGRTNLVLGAENHPILAGFSLDELPLMNAYIATQSKSTLGAENVLLSGNFGDPLLSVWRVGLGYVAAWMGDLGEQWVPEMNSWEKQGKFWQQVARYTLPDPSNREADVRVTLDATQMSIQLSLAANAAGSVDSNPIWVYSKIGERGNAFAMRQVSAGVYELDLPKPETGAYTGIIQYSVQESKKEVIVPFAVNYPDEWQFEPLEDGLERVAFWQEKSQGEMLSYNQELDNSSTLADKPGRAWLSLIFVLLMISWPAEIAIRRWQMPWRKP